MLKPTRRTSQRLQRLLTLALSFGTAACGTSGGGDAADTGVAADASSAAEGGAPSIYARLPEDAVAPSDPDAAGPADGIADMSAVVRRSPADRNWYVAAIRSPVMYHLRLILHPRWNSPARSEPEGGGSSRVPCLAERPEVSQVWPEMQWVPRDAGRPAAPSAPRIGAGRTGDKGFVRGAAPSTSRPLSPRDRGNSRLRLTPCDTKSKTMAS